MKPKKYATTSSSDNDRLKRKNIHAGTNKIIRMDMDKEIGNIREALENVSPNVNAAGEQTTDLQRQIMSTPLQHNHTAVVKSSLKNKAQSQLEETPSAQSHSPQIGCTNSQLMLQVPTTLFNPQSTYGTEEPEQNSPYTQLLPHRSTSVFEASGNASSNVAFPVAYSSFDQVDYRMEQYYENPNNGTPKTFGCLQDIQPPPSIPHTVTSSQYNGISANVNTATPCGSSAEIMNIQERSNRPVLRENPPERSETNWGNVHQELGKQDEGIRFVFAIMGSHWTRI